MVDYPQLELLIGGRWKKADGQPVFNPADERALASYRLLAQILASSLGSEPDPSTRAEGAG